MLESLVLPTSAALADRSPRPASSAIFFFNDTTTTEISTLSLHDALPIFALGLPRAVPLHVLVAHRGLVLTRRRRLVDPPADRKSTRLNSSHPSTSYAVFCLKKKRTRQGRDVHPTHGHAGRPGSVRGRPPA